MKRVESDLLDNLAIIDTPGMLDSISEQDRGYDYQRVIADLHQLLTLFSFFLIPTRQVQLESPMNVTRHPSICDV